MVIPGKNLKACLISPRAFREGACNSHSDSIDGEIKSITKN